MRRRGFLVIFSLIAVLSLSVGFVLLVNGFKLLTNYKHDMDMKQIRKISVCTLIHQEDNPVSEDIVTALVHKASEDYKNNVGIELNIVERHTTLLDVMKSSDLRKEFRSECQSGDIVIVFTNQSMPYINGRTILGRNNREWAVSWVYDTKGRLLNLDLRNPSSRRTVDHEIGHLFGASDNPGLNSIMDEDANCSPVWPLGFREIILDNKFRDFNPPH